MIKLLFKFTIILIFLLSPIISFALPAITSASNPTGNGGSFTIAGTGFGANGPTTVAFLDFEDGVNNERIHTGEGSGAVGQVDWVREDPYKAYYTNTESMSGTYSMQGDTNDGGASDTISVLLPSDTRNIFYSWWFFLPTGSYYPGDGGTYGMNWKAFWLMGSTSTVDDDLYTVRNDNSWLISGNEDTPNFREYTWIHLNIGTWHRAWIWLKGSTTATSADGTMYLWEMDNPGGVTQIETVDNSNTLKALADGGKWERLYINGYARHTDLGTCKPTFDDIYIATGEYARARVEVGNDPVYANCTNLTVATIDSWADTSITCTFYEGSFPEGTAYVFVFDSSGNVNTTGEEITIGDATPDVSPPYLTTITPTKSATNVLPGADIVWELYDAINGVNIDTISVVVETVTYDCDDPELTCSGTSAHYTVTYDNDGNFSYAQEVNWTFDASDLTGTPNAMDQDSGLFTIMSEPSSSSKRVTVGGKRIMVDGKELRVN